MRSSLRQGILVPNNKLGPETNASVRKRRPGQDPIDIQKLYALERPVICINRRLGGIGDVLMTTPILKAIKEAIPHCELVYATDLDYLNHALAEVIRHNPYVDTLISYIEAAKNKYDYTVDITATGLGREKSGRIPPNRIDMFAEVVGVEIGFDPQPIYLVTPEEKEEGKNYIEEHVLLGSNREDVEVIAIQTTSNDPRRTWPEEYINSLVSLLAADPKKRILVCDWGGRTDRWNVQKENVIPVYNIPFNKFAPILDQVDLVVCPDSSILHLAGALDKKTVSIFGPIPAQCRINYYPNTMALQLDLPCGKCWYSPRCTRDKDKSNHYACMKNITPEMVVTAVEKKMKEPIKTHQYVTYGSNLTARGQDPVILVRRVSKGIGDLLMATPGIEKLKEKFPDKELHVAVLPELMCILDNNPYVDKVLDVTKPINYKRYYMTMDISSCCAKYEFARVSSRKPVQKSRVEIFAEALGTRGYLTHLLPVYYLTDEEKEFGKNFIKNLEVSKPTLCIATSCAEQYRNWPKEKYKELIPKLKEDYNVILFDNKKEYSVEESVLDTSSLSIRECVAVLSCSDGLVTPDTSFLHFAAALEVLTVALFGPIDYKARCKGYKNIIIVKSECEFMPCWRSGKGRCKKSGRLGGSSKCMKKIPSAIVQQTIEKEIFTHE